MEALAGRRSSAAAYLIQAAEAAEDDENRAAVHAVTGFNLVDWGRMDEGLEHYILALDHARKAGNRRREIWALGLGSWGLLAANRVDEADAWLGDCFTLVDDQRWIAFRPWPAVLRGEASLRKGAAPKAIRSTLEESFALSCQLADPCWEAAAARGLALTYAAEEEFSMAMDWLREARRRCTRETGSFAALQVEILANQSEISRKRGDPATADAIAREWIAVAARTQMDAHVTRAAAFIAM